MDQPIPHPGYQAPRNTWIGHPKIVGESLNSFANDGDLVQNGGLRLQVVEEAVAIEPLDKLHRQLARVLDVGQRRLVAVRRLRCRHVRWPPASVPSS